MYIHIQSLLYTCTMSMSMVALKQEVQLEHNAYQVIVLCMYMYVCMYVCMCMCVVQSTDRITYMYVE